ncbi:tRNA (adenosine(37)-N6)-threonylcarbamoyltransferase complex dimerization subunit type 1 TsaB [Ferrovibrio sp.]|uniref:tRNA (adenosine(37)-N6)-threonylcarbamoyltransferase complex dimerization subunit type 1 TsaB n=1 Tax=Ferrovibrio sp. TaxID=1917215 RepID=UPI0025B7E3F3|nr:tRNA (adenosine(37)-N6)-threonylcarbamoyltransferase complex dimerization subunit type 1 TsaB [Ferrovibrio sp.]MBX3456085.1 tRNA (adenosine(37)-N6)-threonylcarbamoyltransferase complex dimerization subunit type 1 TsaB [Ferrovibrio sp.]
MKLLLIDTALNACTVGICENARILAAESGSGGKGHAERLLPAIEAARKAAGMALTQLDGLAATIGPGSFTGIRTGLSVARGLALALGKPIWGLVSTQAIARDAALLHGEAVPIWAIIDARRDEVYLQGFRAGIKLGPPELLGLDAARDRILGPVGQAPVLLAGSGARLLAPGLPQARLAQSPDDPSLPALLDLARMAAAADPQPVPPVPLYIRPPDAALPAVVQPAARMVVRCQPADALQADLLAELHGEAYAAEREPGWSADSLRQLLAMPGAFALLAIDPAGQPAGFLLGRNAADEAEVVTIAVRPLARRLGVGAALMEAFQQRAQAGGAQILFLEVAEDNAAGRALYARAGYEAVGRRPGYYQAPPNVAQANTSQGNISQPRGESVAAIVMRRSISPV